MSSTTQNCTIDTCPITEAQVQYVPTLTGNTLYLSIFAFLLAVQLPLGLFYRTWGFLISMTFGLTLEIVGYVARLQLSHDPFDHNAFLMFVPLLSLFHFQNLKHALALSAPPSTAKGVTWRSTSSLIMYDIQVLNLPYNRPGIRCSSNIPVPLPHHYRL